MPQYVIPSMAFRIGKILLEAQPAVVPSAGALAELRRKVMKEAWHQLGPGVRDKFRSALRKAWAETQPQSAPEVEVAFPARAFMQIHPQGVVVCNTKVALVRLPYETGAREPVCLNLSTLMRQLGTFSADRVRAVGIARVIVGEDRSVVVDWGPGKKVTMYAEASLVPWWNLWIGRPWMGPFGIQDEVLDALTRIASAVLDKEPAYELKRITITLETLAGKRDIYAYFAISPEDKPTEPVADGFVSLLGQGIPIPTMKMADPWKGE
jgi:hypothetical protein